MTQKLTTVFFINIHSCENSLESWHNWPAHLVTLALSDKPCSSHAIYHILATWYDNSFVFYIKCGSTKLTFTYVFTGTKTYNTDVLSAFKRTILTYWRHLKMNTCEYWNYCIHLIIIVVFSCHINGLIFFSTALLNCLLDYLIWNYNILFCSVWFLHPARFQE